MNDLTLIVIALEAVVASALAFLIVRHTRQEVSRLVEERKESRKRFDAERKEFWAVIKDLQNRITAKDIGGYQTLQRPNGAPMTSKFGGDDESEYRMEQLRTGLSRVAEEIHAEAG